MPRRLLRISSWAESGLLRHHRYARYHTWHLAGSEPFAQELAGETLADEIGAYAPSYVDGPILGLLAVDPRFRPETAEPDDFVVR